MNFLLRRIITAVAVGVAAWLVPGIAVIGAQTWVGVAVVALFLSLINMSIKPVLQILSIPITILTLGLFYIVVNTALLFLAAWLSNELFGIGFVIFNFGSGFLAAIVISLVSCIVNGIIGPRDEATAR